jgi:hypothetical protein
MRAAGGSNTAVVVFHRVNPKELDGRRVEVTAKDGQSVEEHGTGVFQFHQAHETCACDYSYAEVQLSATS